MAITLINTVGQQVNTVYYEKGTEKKGEFLSENEMKNVNLKMIPLLDSNKILNEYGNWNGVNVPYAFAYLFNVNYTLSDGTWTTTKNERIWKLKIKSQNALSINFVFSKINLSPEAKLYIFNSDQTSIYGPVENDSNTEGSFITDLIFDDEAIIMLIEPINVKKGSEIIISKVGHGFRDMRQVDSKAINGFENVKCHGDWENESNAVVNIVFYYKNIFYLVSGALINNAKNNKKGYILTAFHGIDLEYPFGELSDAEKASIQNSAIQFQYKAISCQLNTPATSVLINGATFRAAWKDTDFALIEINQSLSTTTFPLTFLGWSKSTSNPASGTGIHHPQLSMMKISFDYESVPSNPTTITSYNDFFNYYMTIPQLHLWNATFTLGDTNNGSSGSPLLDSNHRVVGQAVSKSGSVNRYGRFDKSWIGGGTSSTRLRDWFDPDNTGISTLDHLHSYPSVTNGTLVWSGAGQSGAQTTSSSNPEGVMLKNSSSYITLQRYIDAANQSHTINNYSNKNLIKIISVTSQNPSLVSASLSGTQINLSSGNNTGQARLLVQLINGSSLCGFYITINVNSSRLYSVYPNPASSTITVSATDVINQNLSQSVNSSDTDVRIETIRVCNSFGNTVINERFLNKGKTVQLNVSFLTKGVYYIIINEERDSTETLMIE